MVELLITVLIAAIVFYALYYVAGLLPAQVDSIARVVVIVGALIWLLYHVRQIIHTVATGTP